MANDIRIGVTERGDAALDLSWIKKCNKALYGACRLNGAVIITKDLAPHVRDAVINLTKAGFPIVVHATCTGWGGDPLMEPNVLPFRNQIQAVRHLLDRGFPIERTVLRIDPVFPNETGLDRFRQVLDEASRVIPGVRIRISIYDEYPHVRDRLAAKGVPGGLYGGRFYAPAPMMAAVSKVLSEYPQITFETCAEPFLNGPNIEHAGCVSKKDLFAMGLPDYDGPENPQNRKGCLCLGCKTELLNGPRKPCAHGCVYCFWRTPEEDTAKAARR